VNKTQLQAFHEGRSLEAYTFLGAHKKTIDKQTGYEFSVYAPHAKQVELIGTFNNWIGSKHQMKRVHHDFFTLFVPGITDYESYKYHIQTRKR
jgi:1,4-alpha-glucan branching enzyme